MKKKISLLFVLLMPCLVFGQMQNYKYKRKLNGISKQWHSILLPDDIFSKSNNDLSDVRIYGVSGADTVEAPYLLKVNKDELLVTDVPFKIINQSRKGDRSFFTLRVPGKQTINNIKLNFTEQNFDWKVKIEGSNNQNEWFEIADNKRIVSIKQGRTDYAFTELDFYESEYEYYRLSFKSKEAIKLQSATTSLLKRKAGLSEAHDIKMNVFEDKRERTTVLDIKLDKPLLISKVKLHVADSFDYYRPIDIKHLADSTIMGDRLVSNYSNLYNGTLSSLESHDFVFTREVVNRIRVTIYNGDNQPLDFSRAQVFTNQHELFARFTEPATYFLVYGNKLARTPSYDIVNFEDRIPGNLKELTLEDELAFDTHVTLEPQPLFKNKAWLWAIMIVVILLLGWFTFRMIRQKEGE